MRKKYLAMFLVFVLVFTMIPAFGITAYAEEPAAGESGETEIITTVTNDTEKSVPEAEVKSVSEPELNSGPGSETAEPELKAKTDPDYLCFTGTGAFTVSMRIVELHAGTAPAVNLEYCTDDCSVPSNWSTFTVGETEVVSSDGSPVYFRGTGNARFSVADAGALEDYNNFCLTADAEGVTVAASGNIMTLLDYDPVPEALGAGNTNAFAGLFKDCAILTKAPDLPSPVTVHACYMSMFSDCTLLTDVPDLPAENLADRCYYGLFMRCTSLKNAPQMSDKITTAGQCSCEDMFFYCSALEKAPDKLSATTLEFAGYRCMFWYCTSLEKAPEMSIDEVVYDSCCSMFHDCTSLEDVSGIELNASDIGTRSYGSMFFNCKSLGGVPFLDLESLSQESCQQMFYGCKRMLIKEGNADNYDWKIPASTAAVPVEAMGSYTASGSVTVEVPESGYNYYKVDILPWACFTDKNKNGIREEGEPRYLSVDDAADAAADGVEENIVLLCDCKDNARISFNKIIVLDLNDCVLSCDDPVDPVIINYGNLTIRGAGDTPGSTMHKWVPNSNPEDDIPDGLWAMDDDAAGTEGIDYFVTVGGVITGSYDCGIKYSNGSLKLQNTNITGNAAEDGKGGGIHSLSVSSLQITGGRISGNVSADSGGVGGVYVNGDGDCSEVTLGGNAVIDENKGTLADNLAFVLGEGNISLDEPGEDMRVGISLIDKKIRTGGIFAKSGSKDDLKYFFSDADCYMPAEENSQLVLSSRINQQPEQSNNYTVGADMSGLTYKTPYYQWCKPVMNENCNADMFEETIGDTGISGFDYDEAGDTYSATADAGLMMVFHPKAEYLQNMDSISFKVDTEIDYLYDYSASLILPTLMEPDKDGYYTMDIAAVPWLEITGCVLQACDAQWAAQPLTISDLTYCGTSVAEGLNEARLTADEAGIYNCLVTFEDGSSVFSDAVDFVPHVHDWTYKADGATITAVCSGSGICDVTDTTLTVLAPELTIYGGNESADATLSATSLAGQSALPVIHYARKTGSGTYEELKEAPVAAGFYKAYITVNSADTDVTAFAEYTIARKIINVRANDQTSVAGTGLAALTYTADKLVGTDSFTGALATNADSNVAGKYEITRGTLSAGSNYSMVFTNGTYEVTAAKGGTGNAETGDTGNPGLYVLIIIAAAGIVFAAAAVNRKRRAK